MSSNESSPVAAVATAASRVVDTVLDRSLLLGYTRIGSAVRRRLPGWPADPAPDALQGKRIAISGASGGLGAAAALGLSRLGAHLDLIVRDPAKVKQLALPADRTTVHQCDIADLDDVRRLGGAWSTPLHGIVHNAGAMPATRTESPQGHELTMALHVLGPVLLTDLLREHLDTHARIIFVTSGGMYAQKLRADDPEYVDGDYSPTTAYARSKRGQVELLPALGARWHRPVYATHPGWADTPGVTDSIPTFAKIIGPALRTADDGADTTVWLAAVEPAPPTGTLWHDRRRRPIHYLPMTKPAKGSVERFWAWVRAESGIDG